MALWLFNVVSGYRTFVVNGEGDVGNIVCPAQYD